MRLPRMPVSIPLVVGFSNWEQDIRIQSKRPRLEINTYCASVSVVKTLHDLNRAENALVVAVEYAANGGKGGDGEAFGVVEETAPAIAASAVLF